MGISPSSTTMTDQLEGVGRFVQILASFACRFFGANNHTPNGDIFIMHTGTSLKN